MKRIPYYLDHDISGDVDKEYSLHMRLREIVKRNFSDSGIINSPSAHPSHSIFSIHAIRRKIKLAVV